MSINIWTFLFQIVNFTVLAYVLHRLLYRPLHDAIDRRRQATVQAQAEAERATRDAEAMQVRLEAERAEADRQREKLLREAHRQAETEGQRVLDEARKRAGEQADEAQEQLAHQREEALGAVRNKIVQLALDLAERLLTQAAGTTLHRQLAARLVESLETASAEDRRRLLAGWTPEDPTVIETAEGLDRQSIDKISAAVAGLLGQPVKIKFALNSALISGVCLRLGGHVWDASLGGSLDEVRQDDAQEAAHA
jgi:F-type H+-transporting ATPase subunit b